MNVYRRSCVVLTVDLSNPIELVESCSTILTAVRSRLSQLNSNDLHRNFIYERYTDKLSANLFPVPLLILGNKYDLFQVNRTCFLFKIIFLIFDFSKELEQRKKRSDLQLLNSILSSKWSSTAVHQHSIGSVDQSISSSD